MVTSLIHPWRNESQKWRWQFMSWNMHVLNKKYPLESKDVICCRGSFVNIIYLLMISLLSSTPTPILLLFFFSFCFSSSCMLPNLLRCKCLREARFLAFPRGTLVLPCPLPASTQTRAQTALPPKARYCTRPVPLSCRMLCSQNVSLELEDVVAKQLGRI